MNNSIKTQIGGKGTMRRKIKKCITFTGDALKKNRLISLIN